MPMFSSGHTRADDDDDDDIRIKSIVENPVIKFCCGRSTSQ